MSTRIHKETRTNLNEKLILLESFFFILQLLHMHDIHYGFVCLLHVVSHE